MRTSTRLLLNSVANLTGGVVNTVLALVLTPILVHSLGRSGYGAWELAGHITVYTPFIFLGLGGAVGRFVAVYMTQKDYESMNAFVNTALVYFRCGAVAALGIGMVVAFRLTHWTNIDPSLHEATFWCVVIVVASLMIRLYFGPVDAILWSLERFDLVALTQVVFRVIRLVAVVLTLPLLNPEPAVGLLIVAVIMTATDVIPVVIRVFLARHYCPHLEINMRLARWKHLWAGLRFAIATILWKTATVLLTYVPFLVIGHYLSDADVGDYGICGRILAFVVMLVDQVVITTAPVAAKMAARNGVADLQQLLVRSSKYTMGMALPMSLLLGILAPVVLYLWVGPKFLHIANVLLVLSISRCLWCLQNSSFYVLTGTNKHAGLGLIGLICIGAVTVSGSIAIGSYGMGLMGIATATTLILAIGCGVVMPVYTCRQVGLKLSTYIRHVYIRPLLAVIPFVAVCLVLRRVSLEHAWSVLAAVMLAGVVLLPLTYWFHLFDEWDRNLFRDRFRALLARLPIGRANR